MTRTMDSPPKGATGIRVFDVEVREILDSLRSACADVIAAAGTRGWTINKATDLQQALGVPATLAWQVFRVAHARELLDEVQTVPGLKAVRRLVRAAHERGVRQEPLDVLVDAVREFEEVVQAHAGNRKTFNLMVSGLSKQRDADTELNFRRTAFETASHIWGTQVRTKLATFIVHPSADNEDRADVLTIGGTIDLFRLRGDTPYELSNTAVADDSPLRNSERIVALGHPLTSNDVTTPGSTVLTEFGTQPLPTIRNYVDESGRLIVELSPDHVGRQHAVSAFIGEMYRSSVARARSDAEPTFGTTGFVKSPTETWIVDLVIAEGTYGSFPAGEAPPKVLSPYGYMVGNVRGKPLLFNDIPKKYARDILERPPVVYQGQGAGVLKTTDVPRYPEMFEHVCAQLGWDPQVFHVYRCRVEYPVMPSSIAVGFDLPEKAV